MNNWNQYRKQSQANKNKLWLWHLPEVHAFFSFEKCLIQLAGSSWVVFKTKNIPKTLLTQGAAGPIGEWQSQGAHWPRALCDYAEASNLDRIQVQLTPSFIDDQSALETQLLQHGFQEFSRYRGVIDLSLKEALRRNMRKSYRSYWTQIESVRHIDNPTESDFLEMHELLALTYSETDYGAPTPEEYSRHLQMCREGKAMLFSLKTDGEKSFALLHTFEKKAYYCLGASNLEAKKHGGNIKLQCGIMQKLCALNFTHYDVGEVLAPGSKARPGHKEDAISFFKSGLGGTPLKNSIFEKGVSLRYKCLKAIKSKLRR